MNIRNKKIFIIIGIIIFVLAGILTTIYFTGGFESKTVPSVDGIILFYGDTCPHCKILEEWIIENQIKEKIGFANLEVYNNEENRNLLVEKATICKLDLNSIGVPFLWTGTDCVIGDEPIEKFFEQKINLNTNVTTNDVSK